jgi:hypothetical membrane protein
VRRVAFVLLALAGVAMALVGVFKTHDPETIWRFASQI